MSKLSTAGARLVFENAMNLLQANNYDLSTVKLTQSEIRSEVAMVANTNTYTLPITKNGTAGNNIFNTMNLLNLSDVAVVYGAKVEVAKPASSSSTAFDTFPYPNLTDFSNAGTASAIRGAYANGNMSVIVDNQQVVPYYGLAKHYRAPITQQGSNLGYTASAVNVLDSLDKSVDGFFPIEPNWIWSGNSTIQAQLNNVAQAAVETNSRWIVTFFILLAQNASKVANNG